jgi:hypothetical protein
MLLKECLVVLVQLSIKVQGTRWDLVPDSLARR